MKNINNKESYQKPEICVILMETEQTIALSGATPSAGKTPDGLGGTSTTYFKDSGILAPEE